MDNTVNPIRAKLDALVAEREQIFKALDEKRIETEQLNMRICEINGSMQVLVELFGKKPEDGESDDTEVTPDTESDSNEG